MDKSQLRQHIESFFSGKGVRFSEHAIDRLLNPSYLKEDRLSELADKDVQAAVEPLLDECVDRFKKRAKRSRAGRAGDVKLREIDTRTVVRRYFGKAEPYANPPKPEAPAEGEGEGDTGGKAE